MPCDHLEGGVDQTGALNPNVSMLRAIWRTYGVHPRRANAGR
jgi:hypothetical protein